jgi:hypothetical protein
MEQEHALRSYTRRKVSFASLPLDIRHLFTQAEARSYMKDCQLSNLQLSKQTELALYMIEFHPRAFIHQEKTAIKDAACEMLKTLMSTHTPSFSGNIKDEIDLAFFYSLPNARRRQIKLAFKTKSPGYKCLSTLTPAEMATLANAKQFYVSPFLLPTLSILGAVSLALRSTICSLSCSSAWTRSKLTC